MNNQLNGMHAFLMHSEVPPLDYAEYGWDLGISVGVAKYLSILGCDTT
jgi:hypothetical protein